MWGVVGGGGRKMQKKNPLSTNKSILTANALSWGDAWCNG